MSLKHKEKPGRKKEVLKNLKLAPVKRASVKKTASKLRNTLGKQVELKQLSEKIIESHLKDADKATLHDIQSGGAKRLYRKRKGKKLKAFQSYKAMAAMFSRKMRDSKALEHEGQKYYKYRTVDYRGIGRHKMRNDWEFGIGLGHIISPEWKKVLVVYPDGRRVVGIRKVPVVDGVHGEKIGYYTIYGQYIATFTTKPPTRVYLLQKDKADIEKEYKFYKKQEESEPRVSPRMASLPSVGRAGVATPGLSSSPSRPYKKPKKRVHKRRRLRSYPFKVSMKVESIIRSATDPERLRTFLETIEGLSLQDRIIQVARHITTNHIYARHCTDWGNRVYKLAGVKRRATVYRDYSYAYTYVNGRKVRRPKGDPQRSRCGNVHYPFYKLATTLQRGDRIHGNGWNNYWGGNHDMIFERWLDKKRGIAQVISWKGRKRGQKVHRTRLRRNPVVYIGRPS
ncbi:hypothetical protein ACFL3C_04915 [Patescibacteria group bacterium]